MINDLTQNKVFTKKSEIRFHKLGIEPFIEHQPFWQKINPIGEDNKCQRCGRSITIIDQQLSGYDLCSTCANLISYHKPILGEKPNDRTHRILDLWLSCW